uniref:Restorer of fertility-like protein n=1 Tax=Triticum timopheevii TaxID=4570 RepID=A0A7S5S0E5_TRITI|nr:restorer of fertility-like protein [Triticum timopheevii]
MRILKYETVITSTKYLNTKQIQNIQQNCMMHACTNTTQSHALRVKCMVRSGPANRIPVAPSPHLRPPSSRRWTRPVGRRRRALGLTVAAGRSERHHRTRPSSFHQSKVLVVASRIHRCRNWTATMSRLQVRSFSSPVSSRANDLLSELQGHLGFRTLRPELAHQLFDQMMRQPVPVSARALNGLFAALARAPPSAACTDGPALAIDLFNRMARAGRRRVIALTSHTYSILIECCCRVRRPDLGPSFFAHLLKTGVTANIVIYSGLIKCLCDLKCTEEALDVLLHRMPNNISDAISYSVILKSFCDSGRSQLALDLLHMMAKKGADHSPDVLAYNMVIDGFFKEGEVSKTFDLFHEMIQQGPVPDVVTYSFFINALCKARAMDKAEVVLRSMIHNGVQPDAVTYNSLIQGFLTSGQLKEAFRLLKLMTRQGVIPDVVTCNSVMDYLCKHGRVKEAAEIFYSTAVKGRKPDIVSYSIMLHGYAIEGSLVKMIDLCEMMARDGVVPDLSCFNILIKAYAKYGRMDVAMLFFEDMLKQGVKPNELTYLTVISAFCKMGRMDDAMEKFSEMINMGVPLDTEVYMCMVEGYLNLGDSMKAKEFITKMKNRDIHHKPWKGNR